MNSCWHFITTFWVMQKTITNHKHTCMYTVYCQKWRKVKNCKWKTSFGQPKRPYFLRQCSLSCQDQKLNSSSVPFIVFPHLSPTDFVSDFYFYFYWKQSSWKMFSKCTFLRRRPCTVNQGYKVPHSSLHVGRNVRAYGTLVKVLCWSTDPIFVSLTTVSGTRSQTIKP